MLNIWKIQKWIVVVWEVWIEPSGVGAVGEQRPEFVQIIVEAGDEAARPSEGADVDESIAGLIMRVVILCSDP